ncbi:MAG: WecB/TagA/CpsF family glycosyltransferase [Patescibacteria group bacterium]
MTTVNILGVRVDNVSMDEAVDMFYSMIRKGSEKQVICTPNSEFIVDAQKQPVFKNILNESTLSIPDGNGLRFAAKFLNETAKKNYGILNFFTGLKIGLLGFLSDSYLDVLSHTVTGVDFIHSVFSDPRSKGLTVSVIGTKYLDGSDSATQAISAFKKTYPLVTFVSGTYGRSQVGDNQFTSRDLDSVTADILQAQKDQKIERIDLLLVALGHIRQELLIKDMIDKVSCSVLIGVGGLLDFIRGSKRRAPIIIRLLKLEWVFRLLVEPTPWRFQRILKAYFRFCWLVYTYSFKKVN